MVIKKSVVPNVRLSISSWKEPEDNDGQTMKHGGTVVMEMAGGSLNGMLELEWRRVAGDPWNSGWRWYCKI